MVEPSSGSRFKLQCPICGSSVVSVQESGLCQRNGHRFSRSEGIWRFLPLAREAQYREFVDDYRVVRRAEKWSGSTPEYYRALPHVKRGDPQRGIWQIRERNFRRLLDLIHDAGPMQVLDAGAGNCWLSFQLSRRGHTVAALDLSDDSQDGLGAMVNYPIHIDCYQAEFDRMPFGPDQFGLVIFNASLHYSSALEVTLCEAKRMLAVGGRIVVLDSPFYAEEAAGMAMIQERESGFADKFGFRREVANTGFLTEDRIKLAAERACLAYQIWPERLPWNVRLRQAWRERSMGREPARFPLIFFEK